MTATTVFLQIYQHQCADIPPVYPGIYSKTLAIAAHPMLRPAFLEQLEIFGMYSPSNIQTRFSLIILFLLILTGCGGASPSTSSTSEAWDRANDPLNLGNQYEYSFNLLPRTAQVSLKPWTDSYWPSNQGGIANRWIVGQNGFSYGFLDRQTLGTLSLAQMASLSPAEKFDILNGRYDYPLASHERSRTRPTDEDWFGLCHGWASAAINYYEPKSVMMRNADGLSIPFAASDVKALLTFYQGQVSNAPQRVLGMRCDADLSRDPYAAQLPQCRDVNAGAFHVVLANQIGRFGQAFTADVTRDAEVWNQPIHQFSTIIVGYQGVSPGAAIGTVQEVIVDTAIGYTVEINAQWQATNNTINHRDGSKSYRYRLELNAYGQIIGGEWLTFDRPDFLWMKGVADFTGYYSNLGPLYNASITSPGIEFPR